jgi:hypothetical protein
MKSYVATTGAVFGLVVLSHVARVIQEGPRLATDPVFLLLTALSAALTVWAVWLFGRLPRQ